MITVDSTGLRGVKFILLFNQTLTKNSVANFFRERGYLKEDKDLQGLGIEMEEPCKKSKAAQVVTLLLNRLN